MFTKCFPLVLSAGLTLALVAPHSASAQSLYMTGFEDPPFTAGVPLAGQDGWNAPPPLSPNGAVIATDKPFQGKQEVRVWGGDLEHQDFIYDVTSGYYDAIGSYRHTLNHDTGGTQVVTVASRVRLDGPQTGSGNNFFSASVVGVGIDNTGSSNGIGELVLSSDGHVYGDSNIDLVPTFLVSAPITLGEWHDLAVIDDFAARTYSFSVDGQILGTFPFDPSITSNTFRRGSLLAYTAPDTSTLHKGDYTAYYDNFSITAVPEPGSFALMAGVGVSGIAFLSRRRKG